MNAAELSPYRREGRDNLKASAYLLWIYYGQEGWKVEAADTPEELMDRIEGGISNPFIVTRGALDLKEIK